MRTTLDIPDALFREVKAKAALQGLKLKDFLTILIENGLKAPPNDEAHVTQARSQLPVIQKAATGTPIPALSRQELAAIEMEEDLAKHERSSGR